jgi:hypothetical protein
MIFTSLIPFLLSESAVPAVDLIQSEEILHFVNDTYASVTFPLVVIDSFNPDLRKRPVSLYASPFREVVLICVGHERGHSIILGQQVSSSVWLEFHNRALCCQISSSIRGKVVLPPPGCSLGVIAIRVRGDQNIVSVPRIGRCLRIILGGATRIQVFDVLFHDPYCGSSQVFV